MNEVRIYPGNNSYPWNVQIWTTGGDGNTWYCGNGKFCRSVEEILEVAKEWKAESVSCSPEVFCDLVSATNGGERKNT